VANPTLQTSITTNPVLPETEISFETKDTRGYILQYSPTLGAGSDWESLSNDPGNNGTIDLTLTGGYETGFYRVMVYVP
jgi:hypothetical protein